MKKLEWAVFAGLALASAFALFQLPFSERCEQIRSDTLRLHIVANSDSAEDQSAKLAVRDAVLGLFTELSKCKSRAEAETAAAKKLDEAANTAKEALRARGLDYDVRAYLCEMYFDERTYENSVTLPAGRYDALRIELGEGGGRNWWCVMYPRLCLGAAQAGEAEAERGYGEENSRIVLDRGSYRLRFWTEEKLQGWLEESLSGRTQISSAPRCSQ